MSSLGGRVSGFVTLGAAFLLLAGCADDGRELRPASPNLTSGVSTTTTPTTTDAASGSSTSLRLTSTSFSEGQAIPVPFTCEGANDRPPLAWSGVPRGTLEIAVTVTDPDANGFVHWAVAGLDPDLTELSGDKLPEGAIEATNDAGEPGWLGPCPPDGDGPHQYVFTVYALTAQVGLTPSMSGRDATQRIAATPGAAARLTVTFER